MLHTLRSIHKGGIPVLGTTLHLSDLRMAAVLVITITAICAPAFIL